MPCFHPKQAYQPSAGGRPFFLKPIGIPTRDIKLPCNQCIGCRLAKSREWAIRIMHEASFHEHNQFQTLTYADMPQGSSLNHRDFQLFMKRYRKYLGDTKIKFVQVGEYGDQYGRPHIHLCLFGHDFEDKEIISDKGGEFLYTSPTLEKLWGNGFVSTTDLTLESAAYCARYVTKKITGKGADKVDQVTGLKHYERIDPYTGEIVEIRPEYLSCSNGIGRKWYEHYSTDCFPKDFVTHKGTRLKVPKYYDKLLMDDNPELLEQIKENRRIEARQRAADSTPERLADREKVEQQRAKRLVRNVEARLAAQERKQRPVVPLYIKPAPKKWGLPF